MFLLLKEESLAREYDVFLLVEKGQGCEYVQDASSVVVLPNFFIAPLRLKICVSYR